MKDLKDVMSGNKEQQEKLFQAMQNLTSGEISIEEANKISDEVAVVNKERKKNLKEFEEELKKK